MYKIKTCPKYGVPYTSSCDKQLSYGNTTLDIKLEDAEFYKVYSMHDLFEIFEQKPYATYILHGGNTAHGNVPSFRRYKH